MNRREYTTADAFDAGQFVPMGGTRDEWVRALAAGRDAGLSDEDLMGLSAGAANYGGERATRAALRSIKPGAVKAGTWFFLARQAGWTPRKDGEPPRTARPQPAPATRPVEPAKRQHDTLSDHGRKLWSESRPLVGTIGAEYLLARRIAAGKLNDHFTARDVVRKGWSGLSNTAQAETALGILEEFGHVIGVEIEGETGRPTTRYTINPRTLEARA